MANSAVSGRPRSPAATPGRVPSSAVHRPEALRPGRRFDVGFTVPHPAGVAVGGSMKHAGPTPDRPASRRGRRPTAADHRTTLTARRPRQHRPARGCPRGPQALTTPERLPGHRPSGPARRAAARPQTSHTQGSKPSTAGTDVEAAATTRQSSNSRPSPSHDRVVPGSGAATPGVGAVARLPVTDPGRRRTRRPAPPRRRRPAVAPAPRAASVGLRAPGCAPGPHRPARARRSGRGRRRTGRPPRPWCRQDRLPVVDRAQRDPPGGSHIERDASARSRRTCQIGPDRAAPRCRQASRRPPGTRHPAFTGR